MITDIFMIIIHGNCSETLRFYNSVYMHDAAQ